MADDTTPPDEDGNWLTDAVFAAAAQAAPDDPGAAAAPDTAAGVAARAAALRAEYNSTVREESTFYGRQIEDAVLDKAATAARAEAASRLLAERHEAFAQTQVQVAELAAKAAEQEAAGNHEQAAETRELLDRQVAVLEATANSLPELGGKAAEAMRAAEAAASEPDDWKSDRSDWATRSVAAEKEIDDLEDKAAGLREAEAREAAAVGLQAEADHLRRLGQTEEADLKLAEAGVAAVEAQVRKTIASTTEVDQQTIDIGLGSNAPDPDQSDASGGPVTAPTDPWDLVPAAVVDGASAVLSGSWTPAATLGSAGAAAVMSMPEDPAPTAVTNGAAAVTDPWDPAPTAVVDGAAAVTDPWDPGPASGSTDPDPWDAPAAANDFAPAPDEDPYAAPDTGFDDSGAGDGGV